MEKSHFFNVVLVRTLYSSNIGSSARALANMGGGRLILVDPKTAINSNARKGAAGAQEQLKNRVIYNSLKEFYENESSGIYIALSKRTGKRRTSTPLKQALKDLSEVTDQNKMNLNFYLFFGPEDHGLAMEDIKLCHQICSLPEYGTFNSYNLSQAVLITLHIINDFLKSNPMTDLPNSTTYNFPEKALAEWIEILGFDLSSPKVNALNTIRDMVLRAYPNNNELKTFESALQQTIRKLR